MLCFGSRTSYPRWQIVNKQNVQPKMAHSKQQTIWDRIFLCLVFVSLFKPTHDKTNKKMCAPSEDSDQPGHPPSLIRVFADRMTKAWVLSYLLSVQRRLWTNWSDAQVDLSLRWAHSHLIGFVMRRLILNTSNLFEQLVNLKGGTWRGWGDGAMVGGRGPPCRKFTYGSAQARNFIILYIMIVFIKYFLFYQFPLLNYNILYYVATENKVTPIQAAHSCRSFVFLVPFVFKTFCGNPWKYLYHIYIMLGWINLFQDAPTFQLQM